MSSIVNMAAYRFVQIDDCEQLKQDFLALGEQLDLKGTILLSQEGINLMLSGSAEACYSFREALDFDKRLCHLDYKISHSELNSFKRFLVKIKPEIVTLRQQQVQPSRETGRYLSARTLKMWLDLGKPVTLLDTRNQFEVNLGRFKQAIDCDLEHFTEFTQKINNLHELKQQTVVTYCTGGIRCEKATSLMLQQGFTDVYQLEGGILKYFETCGDAHFEGSCFVFDQRETVDSSLQPQTILEEG